LSRWFFKKKVTERRSVWWVILLTASRPFGISLLEYSIVTIKNYFEERRKKKFD
jgi:hypothetical protein